MEAIGSPVRLLISGAADPHNLSGAAYFAGLKKLAEDLQIRHRVFWVNELFYVDERQLRSLYLVADALLFPSKQEGFGLPLLEAAAYLHDVGHFISGVSHHKHSHYLIANADLPGLLDEEVKMAAQVARYHRRKEPSSAAR